MEQPFYSVVVPAYNEEAYLKQTLTQLKGAMKAVPHSGEVLVVDNNSTDKTAFIAKSLGVNVVFEPINQISKARNTGAKHAKAPHLIFLDADSSLPPSLLKQAITNLESGACAGGGALVEYEGEVAPIARKAVHVWNWISKTFSLSAGSFIYCLREGFEAVGGFDKKVYASEEIWLSGKLKKWGKKQNKHWTIITAPPLLTSPRKLEWFSLHEILFWFIFMCFFPFFVRFKSLCRFWYTRPSPSSRRKPGSRS